MLPSPGRRFVIHPPLASLAGEITKLNTKTPAATVEALRDSCRRKLATYSLEAHLRHGAADPVAARAMWDAVAAFVATGRNVTPRTPAAR